MDYTMKEYAPLLEAYSHDYYKMFIGDELDNKIIAEQYFEKYWLPEQEYLTKWKPLQDQIFVDQRNGIHEAIYLSTFEMLALRGGVLFVQEGFEQLQSCIKTVGDKNIVIIQNTFGYISSPPPFRMKFPVDITWEEISSGDFISEAFLYVYLNEYFVFSESASWGKYAASDTIFPLDLIGFKPEHALVFKEQFKQSEEEREEMKGWLPEKYKGLIV